MKDKTLSKYVKLNSIKKTNSYGFMSTIYTGLDKQNNSIIIHKIKPVNEQIRHKTYEKIASLSSILSGIPVPTAKVITSFIEDNYWYILQEKLPGFVSGKREIRNGKIIDRYKRKFVEEKALRYLAHLHKICFRKFGIIKIKKLVF